MFVLLIVLSLFSCKEDIDITFDKAIIYNYGHSEIGITYDIPVKFFVKNKEIAYFRLYSMDENLANGIYNYSDVDVVNYIPFGYRANCSDKTFFKDRCKWNNNTITRGSVTVEKQNDKYTFIVNITDNKGVQHRGKFSGKVKKEDWYEKSKTGGLFNCADIWESYRQPNDGTFEFALQMNSGDTNNEIQLNATFIVNNPTDATGVYEFYNDVWCQYTNYPVQGSTARPNEFIQASGTIIITRVNEGWKYKVDVDVVSEKGVVIKGSFDGCDMRLWGNFFE
ncbi:MAG: hypothetical protein LBS50_07160 [Prevotellaceae bacterium]|jgi:hypothetical protein|nr:hypothetical protein [Prevotellaceae bacterium]